MTDAIETTPATTTAAIEELRRRRRSALAAGGEERVVKQHARGKYTARERMEILFDARFLIDILSILDAPQAVLLVSKPTDPCIIKVLGDEDAFTHVIMPVLPK